MALKFRRGTTAQQSGSLAFGEPYINTTLGTLVVGGASGDIILSTTGTGSTGTFGAISGSGLDITGNANIAGNLTLGGTITIGDATTDNVVVNADLSSSIIPNNDNAFDLGSSSYRYRAIYGTNIYGAINATNGIVSGSSQLNTLGYSTTGSNTFIGNQTIIGSGTGFAAYISTSVNDGTLGLDTTANVNAMYFLKATSKNFEVSYDTSGANGIFRLLPYNNNSFFEIGNPSNAANTNTDYVFVAESTYGNILLGPGIGNATAYLGGATPATDKVQIKGNLYVSGAIKADSFTGSIGATNGIVSGSAQVVGILSSLNSFSASNGNTSLNSFSASNGNTSLNSFSASNGNTSLNSYTASNDTTNTTQNTRLTRIEESTASLNLYTASNDTTNTAQNNRLTRLEESTSSLNSLTGSYAKTNSANTFNGTQTISGSLFITQDLVVGGSSSIQNISSSNIAIGAAYVTLNTFSPSSRFAGLRFVDSGSAGGSGSLFFDSVDDEIVFVHKGNGTNVTSSQVLMGPETYDNLGNEIYLTSNRIPKSTNYEHLGDSNITDTGTLITLGSNTVVAGTIVASGTALVSGSAQINYTQLSGISANIISASTDSSNVDFIISGGSITANLYGGVVSGSAQIVSVLTSLNSYTASNDTTNTTQNNRLSRIEESTASINVTTASLNGHVADINTKTGSFETKFSTLQTYTASIDTKFSTLGTYTASVDTKWSTLATYTGSNDTTNTTQNTRLTRIEESTASINLTTASLATTYEGRASASKTIFSGSTQIPAASITNAQLANSTISGIALGSNLGTLTIGTGLSGTSYNGSAGVTIANTGVLSITSNTGLSSNVSATGNVTITNTGVTSNVAGTGVSVSGATGAVTISIGQAVATSSNVQFNSLGIGSVAASGTAGRIDASGDIVAYSTSDKNFKENITPIPNALEKISKISGNIYDWKADMKEFHGFEGNDVGVIAQEIEEVLPQLVTTRETGYKAVKYDKLVALLIEGIKEQQQQIHSLTLEVEELKKQKGL